ncbi:MULTISPECIES: acetyl-CoA C-acetyltransferase [unclassified Chelatococcus]|uniref:acetyl-CoA C-acetyltransferase n=1 Tax=unclassified Chelatococcus TaxID=2638111 RepID=UPI001BCF0B94|nr:MULTISPECIES: acetyl-CoA C-acetyltransferase [unclassified Chelatococcus]MBS7743740.1 acetyl-CoA C-acetyltransferase [Chelatococcus sp. HY11]MBX3547258.1 acetyl-CoA C-acetyltransferase [Chelatococcus sp.]CAH1664871.1 3-ketoacyl-CoA thiolase [Hyphomicrobiales bacterium]CAH1688501.1 3-ketoacyl-CoA thiolase [Hyphomicrobiales bacterium]
MEAYIYDHVRTPRGKGRPDGALHEITSVQLATQLLEALRDRNDLETSLLDDVIIGMAQPVGEQGGVLARAAVLQAGYAQTVGGQQVHRFCATGLDAVNLLSAQIHSGMIEAGIGGGVESMSRTVMGYDSGAWTSDPTIAFRNHYAPQGIGADLIASLDGFTREDVDAFAVESQNRAAQAWQEARFKGAIVPVKDVLGDVVLDHDEHMRPGTTLETLAKLKPSFEAFGKAGFEAVAKDRYPQLEAINYVHHGGNSSGIVDGAGLVLLGSKVFGEKAGMRPRARIVAYANIGSEPTIMLTAPAAVCLKALRSAGMSKNDVDLWELNEAFASVVLRFMNEMELPHDRVNVNGGAIAMGHPLGATGAMLVGTVLDELERRDLETAAISLCAANGLGAACIIERV